VAPGGDAILVASEDGLWAMSPRQPPRRLAEGGSDDVVICAGRAVALGQGTVSTFAAGIDGEPQRESGVAVRAIRCAPGAAGPGSASPPAA